MTMQEITIRVAPEAAAIYLSANERQRKKLDALLSLSLSVAGSETRSLQTVIQEASMEAQAKGLTAEILQEILDGA